MSWFGEARVWRLELRAGALAAAVAVGSGGCCGCDFCSPDFGPVGCGSGLEPWSGAGGAGGGVTTPTRCPDGIECGSFCCGSLQACWRGERCVSRGVPCIRSADCERGDICDFESAGAVLVGWAATPPETCPAPLEGVCISGPDWCDSPAGGVGCVERCVDPVGPPTQLFAPVATWGDSAKPDDGDSVVGGAVVMQLDDDNCDTVVDEDDVPEILFVTAANNGGAGDGVLHALSMSDGALVERWSAGPSMTSPIDPASSPAAARLAWGAIVVVCTTDQRVRAYDGDGVELWLGPPGASCNTLAVADLGGNAAVVVVSESQLLSADTGTLITDWGPTHSGGFAALVGVVSGPWTVDGLGNVADFGMPDGYFGMAWLNAGAAYAVVEPSSSQLFFSSSAGGIDLHAQLPAGCPLGSAGALASGGPPAMADVNGDGVADVGVATARGYVVLDGGKLADPTVLDADKPLWSAPNLDCDDGQRGGTLFDFDGDGRSEVVTQDALALRIYGSNGVELASLCNTTEPGLAFPLVADVDGDGRAEIVAPSSSRLGVTCNGTESAGITVFEATPSRGTRTIFNQFPYSVDSIGADGHVGWVPSSTPSGTFRSNVANTTDADLAITLLDGCGLVAAVVENVGGAAVRRGAATIRFFADDEVLGDVAIQVPLDRGAAVEVRLVPVAPPSGLVHAAILTSPDLHQCTLANDASAVLTCP